MAKETTPRSGRISRRTVLTAAAASAGSSLVFGIGTAPAQVGQNRPFQGTTLNVSCWSAPYPRFLADYIPEFTERTGIRVNYDTPGFPIYNQRVDLELSTRGSAFDVLNITFIFTSRWIGAGWFTPLEPYINDRNKTPADWDFGDFLAGAVSPLRDRNNVVHGVPWIADAFMSGCSRFDIIRAAGMGMPDTFEELERMCATIHNRDGVPAFVTENHFGWTWIAFLQGFGGNVFRNPPDDLMPTLDTPEAVAAAEFFAKLVRDYGPEGALSYNYDAVVAALRGGRVNYSSNNQAFLTQMGEAGSRVAATSNYSIFPKGPAGRFPGVGVHGWGIPAGSRNKDAAWEFIKWSMSKELLTRIVREKGYGAITRQSILDAPFFKERMTINGVDIAKIYADTINLAAAGYMRYRTVHVYPQVNTQITQAIERVVSRQMGARESLRQAQTNSIADLRRAGVRLQ